MDTTPIWRVEGRQTNFPILEQEITSDVVIVGGGITGITLALNLVEQGKSVVLLEAHDIGAGSTSYSTGNLYATVSQGIQVIVDRWDEEIARSVTTSRRSALEQIESRIQTYSINCNFHRCSVYRYATSEDAKDFLEKEFQASLKAALPVRKEENLPFPFPHLCGLVIVLDNQAQFNPHAYISDLAHIAVDKGCRIFENSRALEIDMDKRLVYTEKGKVIAREIVLATHSPIGFHLVQAGMVVNREYGIAARVSEGSEDSLPPGIFWGKGEARISVRPAEINQRKFLVCVGGEYRTGQEEASINFERLKSAAHPYLDGGELEFHWSAQNYTAADSLPYIGRDESDCFIATGFQTDGLVYGTLAAAIIADQILERDNVYTALYEPNRFSPVKSAQGIIKETKGVLTSLIKDYLLDQDTVPLSQIGLNEAGMVEFEDETVAVYRDENGKVHAVSPVCTHLKCRVHWNNIESSWDCPCHGSRFAPDGTVLEGPAKEPLERKFLNI